MGHFFQRSNNRIVFVYMLVLNVIMKRVILEG